MDKRVISTATGSRLEVLTERGPFDKGIAALRREGVRLISAERLALVRVSDDPKSPFSMQGNWVAENYIYATNGDILVASGSYNPLLKNPERATDAHRAGKEFYLEDKVFEELRGIAKADPEEAIRSGVLLVMRKDIQGEIPSNRLAESPIGLFLFRQQAKPYGEWLKAQGALYEVQGIRSITQWTTSEDYAKKQQHHFGRALWVHGLFYRSGLGGDDQGLHDILGRVHGVREVPAERVTSQLV